jgi:acetoin utilization protein AcuC
MNDLNAAFIHSDEIEKFHYPENSPFKTERAGRTRSILRSMGFYTGSNRIEIAPVKAEDAQIAMFHQPEYIESLKRVSAGKIQPEDIQRGLGIGDCPVFSELFDYASIAAGASITGANLIIENKASVVFNPSGGYHHALASEAGGFCYINDVVLACETLRRAGKKVLCLDLDAHHGNGTQAAFYGNKDVFTISLHETGETLFPWGGFENEIGQGEGIGYNVNLPFPAGTDDEAYLKGFKSVVPPLVSAYNPDVLVVEIGMDILSVDPLTHLSMTNNVIADILMIVNSWKKPMLAVGGGGYSFEDTARGWALAWCVLCGIEMEEDLYMGLGGMFLGNAEWGGGLRDQRVYAGTDKKLDIDQKISASVDRIRKAVFPIHGI